MAKVVFAKAFRRHVECPDEVVDGSSLRVVLHGYFARHPATQAYVLDELGAVRKHITVFVNSNQISDRRGLADALAPHDTVHVFQALSGG